MNKLENPYVGPRTFEIEERDRFFGRDREARELLSLAVSEQLVLFYAQSGAGKSSLINTCLIRDLERKGFKVLPVARVGGDAPAGLQVKNIYVFNLIRKLATDNLHLQTLAHMTLSEFLVVRKQEALGESSSTGNGQDSHRRVLIVDQFEELFNTHHEEWEKRSDFFIQLAQTMQEDPNLWVVLVMREDFIAALEPHEHLLPGRLRMRYYMQRLSRESALRAIKGPAEKLRPFAEGVAEKLVDDLCSVKVQKPDGSLEVQPGQYVEPVQLQVVCLNLWENLNWEDVLANEAQITAKDLEAVGDVNTSLGNYYAKRVEDVAKKKDFGEREIRKWIEEKLIAPGGIRIQVLLERTGRAGGLDNEIIQALQSDLIRAEPRGGVVFYELTHDRLVEPILKSNKAWFENNSSLLQKQTAFWVAQGRPDGMLLRGNELEQAEIEAKSKTITRDEADFLAACGIVRTRERREKRNNRLIQIMAVGASIASIAALMLWNQANTKAIELDLERKKAEDALLTATFALSTAEAANQDAQSARGIIEAEALAGRAQIILGQSDSVRLGQLLAVEAYKINDNVQPGEILPSVYQALFKSAGTGSSVDRSFNIPFFTAAFSAHVDRKLLVVDNILFNLEDIDQPTPLDIELDEVAQTTFLSGEKIVFLVKNTDFFSYEQNPYNVDIIDLNNQKKTEINLTVAQNAYVADANLSDNGRWATITYSLPEGQGGALLWNITNPSSEEPALRLQSRESDAISTVVSKAGDRVAMVGGKSLYLYTIDAAPKSDLLIPVFTLALDLGFDNGLLPGQSGRGIKYSDNGQRLALLTRSNIRVYDTNTGKIIAGIPVAEGDAIVGFLFSPDGKYLVYTIRSKRGITTVLRWPIDETDPKPFEYYRSTITDITAMDVSNGGKLIVGDEAGYVRTWEVGQDGNNVPSVVVSAHAGRITNLLLGPDEQTIISTSDADGTRLWELTEGTTEAVFVHQISNDVSSVARSDDGETVVVGGINPDSGLGNIRVYSNLQVPNQLVDVEFGSEFGTRLEHLAVSNDWIAAARTAKRSYFEAEYFLDLWRRNAGESQQSFVTFPLTSSVSSLTFYPGGRYLAIASSTGDLWIDDTADLNRMMESFGSVVGGPSPGSGNPQAQLVHKAKLPNDLTNIQSLIFARNGRYLIGASTSGVRIWDMQNLEEEKYLPLPNAVYPISVSPDQKWLVTAGYVGDNNVVQRFDLENITSPPNVLSIENTIVTELAFSTNVNWLAVATKTGKIFVFDVSIATPLSEPKYTLRGPSAEITSIRFSPIESPGGEWLVASSGKTIYLWNLNRLGDKPIVLEGPNGKATYAGFTNDGMWIVAAFSDQTLRHWSLDLKKVSSAACKFAGRNLRRTEWESSFPKIPYTPENADTCGEWFEYGLETLITVTSGPTATPGPTSAFVRPPTPTITPVVTCQIYIVQEGDSLQAIATRFQIDLSVLIADNQISNLNLITVGQSLKIRTTNAPCSP